MKGINYKFALKLLAYRVRSVNTKLFDYDPSQEKDIDIINTHDKTTTLIPKLIWMYWDGEVPTYLSKVIEKIKKLNPSFTLNLLNKDNLDAYINDIEISSNIPIANKTDIIRLKLLYEYGGVWIDGTTLFYSALDDFYDFSKPCIYDVIGFYKDSSTIYYDRPIIENWMMMSPPQSVFIKTWLDTLLPLGLIGADDYFKKIESRDDYKEIVQGITKPKYLLAYLAEQIVMKDYEFNVYLKKSEANAFLYQEKVSWDAFSLAVMLCFQKSPKNPPPLIKLTSVNRLFIDKVLRFKLFSQKSIIAFFMRS